MSPDDSHLEGNLQVATGAVIAGSLLQAHMTALALPVP